MPQMLREIGIAGRLDRSHLRGWKFVRSPVPAARLHPNKRAIIHHVVMVEKVLRLRIPFRKEPPEPATAHLRLVAVEAHDRPFRMLGHRLLHRSRDPHPVAHQGDFPKRHPRLRHAPGTRIHPEEKDALFRITEAAHIKLVRSPGILERVVDMRHRLGERKPAQARDQFIGGSKEGSGDGHAGQSRCGSRFVKAARWV